MTQTWYELDHRPTGKAYWAALVRKQPSAVLLVVQILAILLLPWLEHLSYGRAIFTALSFIAVTMAIWTVRSTPALTWLALLIGFPAFLMEVWTVIDPSNQSIAFVAHMLLGGFYLYIAYGLISYMFADSWVTKDELFAVGACFTVLMYAYAYLFIAIQTLAPGTFTASTPGEQRSFLELLYLSAANLTSVGLSDVVAVRSHGRAAVILEQLSGVLYVAMVISRLVALTVMKARN